MSRERTSYDLIIEDLSPELDHFLKQVTKVKSDDNESLLNNYLSGFDSGSKINNKAFADININYFFNICTKDTINKKFEIAGMSLDFVTFVFKHNRFDLLERGIRKGAIIKDDKQNTLLKYSGEYNNEEMFNNLAEILIKDAKSISDEDRVILKYAKKFNNKKMIDFLSKNSCDVDSFNIIEDTQTSEDITLYKPAKQEGFLAKYVLNPAKKNFRSFNS